MWILRTLNTWSCLVNRRYNKFKTKIQIKSLKNVTNLRYLETVLLNQICMHEGINSLNAKLNPICHLLALLGAHHIHHVCRVRVKRRLTSGDAWGHSFQSFLSSRLLFRNIKIQYSELRVSCCVKLILSRLAKNKVSGCLRIEFSYKKYLGLRRKK